MHVHLSGLGDTSFLPNVGQPACVAAGGTWVPYRTPADSCVIDTGAVVPVPVPMPNPLPTQPAACGVDECGWWDQVWVRDACLTYLRCANPSDPRVIAMDQGFFTGAGAAVGGAAGQAGRGLLSGLFQNADGTTNFVTVGLIGLLGVVLISKK